MPVNAYGLREKLSLLGKNIVLTGEICGPGIQKNKLRLAQAEWYVFDVKDWDSQKYLPYDDAVKLCADLGIPVVPLEERGEAFDYSLEQLLEKAKGKYKSGLDKEGIVVRDALAPKVVSFKVLNNDALLKEKD
jgi:ATP-dependent RNA circularization protein (DNA/RNA ligase family)